MNRRDFVSLAGATMAFAPAARAQQKAMPVIGYLSIGAPAGRERYVGAFRAGLADRGYIDGENVVVEFHYAGDDYARLPQLAAELVHRRPELIVVPQLPSALAAKAATATIPIVFLIGDDPVKYGLAVSFNHPGTNATGVSMLVAGLVAKRFELLRDLVPNAVQVAVLLNPSNQNAPTQLAELRDAARTGNQRLEIFKASSASEIDTAFAAIARSGAQALLIGADPFFFNSRTHIIGLAAARYAIPGIYEWREFVELGGLASYGPSNVDMHRELGRYAARVLKGERPADLPIIQPTKFELVINLKAAKGLGLTVPQSILARADEVVE